MFFLVLVKIRIYPSIQGGRKSSLQVALDCRAQWFLKLGNATTDRQIREEIELFNGLIERIGREHSTLNHVKNCFKMLESLQGRGVDSCKYTFCLFECVLKTLEPLTCFSLKYRQLPP